MMIIVSWNVCLGIFLQGTPCWFDLVAVGLLDARSASPAVDKAVSVFRVFQNPQKTDAVLVRLFQNHHNFHPVVMISRNIPQCLEDV